MRRANLLSGAVLAIFGLVMLLIVIPAQIEPGPEDIMSPRLVPNMMMVLVSVLSLALILSNLPTGRTDPDPAPISRAELLSLGKHAVVFAAALGLFLFGTPLIAGFVLIGGLLLALGERRLWMIALMPAAILLATWLLFEQLLGTVIL